MLCLSKIGSVPEKSPVGTSPPHPPHAKAEAGVLGTGRTTLFSESVRASSTISPLTFYLKAQKIVLSIDRGNQIIVHLNRRVGVQMVADYFFFIHLLL